MYRHGVVLSAPNVASLVSIAAGIQFSVGDLVGFYKEAKKRFDEDPAFKDVARREVGTCTVVCLCPVLFLFL